MYNPPRDDLNAPDLYIPIMFFATFVLLTAFFLGTGFKFTPVRKKKKNKKLISNFFQEVFGLTLSNGFVMLTIEVLLLKFGYYFFCSTSENPSPDLLDFLSYSGYKFFSACICSLFSFIFGQTGYFLSFLYCGVCLALIIRNYFSLICPKGTQSKYFIFSAMILQFVFLFSLGRN